MEPFTTAQFCNVTLVGPIGQDDDFFNISFDANKPDGSSYINGGGLFPNNGSRLGQYQAGVQIRRNSRLSLQNSVVMGYPVGVIIENDKLKGSQENAEATGSTFRNVFFAGYTDNAADAAFDNKTVGSAPVLGADANKKWQDTYSNDAKAFTEGTKSFSHTYVLAAARNNRVLAAIGDLKLNQPNSLMAGANYGPQAGSPLLDGVPAVSGFDDSAFAGAFRSDADADNWMLGWTNFDPQNTAY